MQSLRQDPPVRTLRILLHSAVHGNKVAAI